MTVIRLRMVTYSAPFHSKVKPFRSAGLEMLQARSSNASGQQLQVCNRVVADVITTVGVSGRKRQVSRFIQVNIIYSRESYPLYRLRFI